MQTTTGKLINWAILIFCAVAACRLVKAQDVSATTDEAHLRVRIAGKPNMTISFANPYRLPDTNIDPQFLIGTAQTTPAIYFTQEPAQAQAKKSPATAPVGPAYAFRITATDEKSWREEVCGTKLDDLTKNIRLVAVACLDWDELRKLMPTFPQPEDPQRASRQTQVLVLLRAGDLVKFVLDDDVVWLETAKDPSNGMYVAMPTFDGWNHRSLAVDVFTRLE